MRSQLCYHASLQKTWTTVPQFAVAQKTRDSLCRCVSRIASKRQLSEKLTTKFQNHFNQIEDVQNKISKASEASSKFSSSATTIKSLLEGIKKPKDE